MAGDDGLGGVQHMHVLLTGVAGFIGSHVARALLDRGDRVTGIDNLNSYYDPKLKADRLAQLEGRDGFQFHRIDCADRDAVMALAAANPDIDSVCHLAAQAGVRYSLIDPYAYVTANVMGHLVMMEAARTLPALSHLVYASSSSVYGGNTEMPFSVADRVDRPVSLYAATKRATELLSHAHADNFGLPSIGLRFFTVYGPWGRPDMAIWMFTKAILAGDPIDVFNHGEMRRDFTYIDDIVAGVIASLDRPPAANADGRPFAVYNLGNNHPERLGDLIVELEGLLGRSAEKVMLPMQTGDVRETYADIEASRRDLDFAPRTPLKQGLSRFVDWYRDYHKV